jgi:hypothetical protein
MDLSVLITPSGHPSGRQTCEAPLPLRQAGAGMAGLPGHAVASRMRAKEVSFILCPPWSDLIDSTPPIPLWRDGARSSQMQQTTFALSDFHRSLSEPPGI